MDISHIKPPAQVTLPVQPVINSRTLLSNRQVVVIEHRGEYYTLRETKQGKLILTK